MNYSELLKGSSTGQKAPHTSVDACYKVNGKLSNAIICEDMLDGVTQSQEVKNYLVEHAKDLGFSPEEALKYWG